MIDKIESRFKEMSLQCATPKELYYLILALQEFEVYKKIKNKECEEVFITTLLPEDYD